MNRPFIVNEPTDAVATALRLYGSSCMSYSTLQEGMRYWIDPCGGYIAYMPFSDPVFAPLGRRLVLSDPVVCTRKLETVLAAFCRDPAPTVFLQVNKRMASILQRDHGYSVARFGYETSIAFTGSAWSPSSHLLSICKEMRRDVRHHECFGDDVDFCALSEISATWLARSGGTEYVLLTRPFAAHPEVDVRYFVSKEGDRHVAFVVFDPMYQDGKVMGYYQNIVRYLPCGRPGVASALTAFALDAFAAEGYRHVSLGLSPLADVLTDEENIEFRLNPSVAIVLDAIFRGAAFAYPFRGNVNEKKLYGGTESPRYVALSEGGTMCEIASALLALRVWNVRNSRRWMRLLRPFDVRRELPAPSRLRTA